MTFRTRALEESMFTLPVVPANVLDVDIPLDATFSGDELFENFFVVRAIRNKNLQQIWDLWRSLRATRVRHAMRSFFDVRPDNMTVFRTNAGWVQQQLIGIA